MSAAITLLDLRRKVMRKFGDLVTVTATANGTTTTLIDEDTIVGEPGRFAGRSIRFLTGANAGEERYISGSSRDTSSITFSRALPVATAEGDTADITNAYGIGVTFDAVDGAINAALAEARDYALVAASYDVPDTFDGITAHTVDLPADFVALTGVMQQHATTGQWQPIARASSPSATGWWIDHAARTVHINGGPGKRARGLAVRLYGYELPTELADDSDTTTIDLSWLLNKACAIICLDTLTSRTASNDWGSKGLFYSNQADDRIAALTPNLGPSFVRI